jgi:hypothetical protein
MLGRIEAEVLGKSEEAPEWGQGAAFCECGDCHVDDQYGEIGGQDAEGSFEVEFTVMDGLVAREFCEELAADEVAGEDEEEVDACPAPAAEKFVESWRLAEHVIVKDEYYNDGQGPEMIQTGEAVACGGVLHELRDVMVKEFESNL